MRSDWEIKELLFSVLTKRYDQVFRRSLNSEPARGFLKNAPQKQ